jgi:LmeA-like phospholipid-binding
MMGTRTAAGCRQVLAAIALLLLCAGCSRVHPFQSMERSVRAELPGLIGPADRYTVAVSHSSSGLLAGRIPWIAIHGTNVRALPELTLDQLEVHLEGVHFDRGSRSVRQIEQSRFQARIGPGSLANFLHSRRPELRDVRVRISGGSIRVQAAPALLGMGLPLEVTGRPVLHGPTTLNFEASRVSVLRLGLPEFAVRQLQERINPLLDLSSLSLPVQLQSVRIDGESLLLTGTAALDPARLRPAGDPADRR